MADGGTGSQPEAVAADFGEYCSSLGLDLDCEEDEAISWLAQEAFDASLPPNWAEYTNEEGRVYYCKHKSRVSTWEHPMDCVYRELVALVKQIRAALPRGPEAQRVASIRAHLQEVQQRAKQDLQVWSGPYAAEQGQEYYFNEQLNVSTWEPPMLEWETQLRIRLSVLCRCLLTRPVHGSAEPAGGAAPMGMDAPMGVDDLADALRLPLGLLRRETGTGDVPGTPPASQFHTARSAASSRSGRSGRTKSERSHEHRRSKGDSQVPPPPHGGFQAVD